MAAQTYIALLRGINVGGNNKLPMKQLTEIFQAAGAKNVRTYIQSGNVVFQSGAPRARSLCDTVSTAIQTSFGFRPLIVLRTAQQLREAVERNPFLQAGADPAFLHVSFLEASPDAARVAAIDPNYSPPDAFQIIGFELYYLLPNGMGNAKLPTYLDRQLKVLGTARNWRTVMQLLALAEPVPN